MSGSDASGVSLPVPESPASSSKRSFSRGPSNNATGKNSRENVAAVPPQAPNAPSLSIPTAVSTTTSSQPINDADDANSSPVQAPLPPFLCLDKVEIQNKWFQLELDQRQRLSEGFAASRKPPAADEAANGATTSPDQIANAGGELDNSCPWIRCTGDDVLNRNRYANVDPWASNRVRLVVPDGQNDYINASPIVLESGKTGRRLQYIATQGPKVDLVSHIWRMAWHSSPLDTPAVIVMLTQTHEAGREKCYPYYPRSLASPTLRVNPQDEFHDGFTHDVRLISLTREEEARTEVRELEMVPVPPEMTNSLGDGQTKPEDSPDEPMEADASAVKKIYHLLFTSWPDFSVPAGADRSALLSLLKLSRTLNGGLQSPHPRIIHCSAGVGRSGTFIALDYLLQELDDGAFDLENLAENEDPIFDTVDRLRKQRMMMVQGESQWAFLYEVLREAWEHRWRRLHGHVSDDESPRKKARQEERRRWRGEGEGVEPAGDEDEHAELEVELMDADARFAGEAR